MDVDDVVVDGLLLVPMVVLLLGVVGDCSLTLAVFLSHCCVSFSCLTRQETRIETEARKRDLLSCVGVKLKRRCDE